MVSEKLLQQILSELKEVKTDIRDMKSDIQDMKTDILDMKTDILDIKNEQQVMKSQLNENTEMIRAIYDRQERNRCKARSVNDGYA